MFGKVGKCTKKSNAVGARILGGVTLERSVAETSDDGGRRCCNSVGE